MIKTMKRGGAVIVIIEDATSLEVDLINEAMRLEKKEKQEEETYEQLNLADLSSVPLPEKKGMTEKEKKLLNSMPVFDNGKPTLRQAIANLSGNPFINAEQMKQILKADYDYDYDPDNPDALDEIEER